MRFRLLGPLECRDPGGAVVEIGGAKPRALLALLLSEAGRVVSVDRVAATLWGDAPPPAATATIQSYISQLRRALGADLIVTRSPGYLAVVEATDLDLTRLPALVDEAAEAEPLTAARLLTEAVELWRGDPLTDLPEDDARVTAERTRLTELHLLARQRRAAAWTRMGRAAEAVAELERLVAEHPLREGLWAALIEALFAAGRQADALAAFQRCRRILADELGIDPGPELRKLEMSILRQEDGIEPDKALLGRQPEVDRIRAALGDATRGNGGVIVLEGEAGIGKTTLAEAAATMAGAQGWRPLWSRCADAPGVPPLWPWLQVLERLDGGGLRSAEGDDPELTTFALFQELRRRLSASAAPLLVVLDDVQAADATSLSLLTLLARHLDGLRLLLVITVRTLGEQLPPEVVDCLAALAREPRAQRLTLTGLTEADLRELVGDDEVARVVHERTDGNPFFAGELVELMRAGDDALPPSVRDVLDRRLARLPQETRALLDAAAVIGRDAGLALLQAAVDKSAEEVLTHLEPAVAARVLRFDETAWSWRFSHALIQETLLAGLGRLDAARLHARIARVVTDVDRLAHHYFHAVPITGAEPAVRYAKDAAAAAREQHAHAEAAAHTRRALALTGAADAGERHRLLVALGDDLLRTGRLDETREVVAEAIAVARRLGDPERLAEAASVWGGVTLWNWRSYGEVDEPMVALLEELAEGGDPALQAKLLGTLGAELAYSDRHADRVAYAERAVALAREIGDPALLGRTLNNYQAATWGLPDKPERWLESLAESLSLAGRGLPVRHEFFARMHRGPLRLHLGDPAGFVEDLTAATRLAARLTGPDVQPHVFYQQAAVHMLAGRWDEAERLATQADERYRGTNLWGAQMCRALHAFTFRRRDGRIGEAVPTIADAARELNVPMLHGLAAVAAAEAGDPAEARRMLRRLPSRYVADWTSDTYPVVLAWAALALGDDLTEAYEKLLIFEGRQIVVGTATAWWGPYDRLLADLAEAAGEPERAAKHQVRADELDELVARTG
ncbi:BTAD domain-containing putative transcriptional regulator [Actinoplanes sp. CA-142083]|uniref:BTAD domain-containing putative transcriptional regulator n=1 Tax=Actinoplanes sp. CA-142083 TaxID=3239903 RepID=UPI003D8A0FC3